MLYDARPRTMGSWTFLLREGGPKGLLAAEIHLKGFRDEGTIRVGEVPFTIDREGMGRTYRLLFEGRAMARAEPQGALSNGYDLTVEAALLVRNLPVGEQVRFEWVPTTFGGGEYELHTDSERIGHVKRTAMLFRHFVLTFEDVVPPAIQAFCFALVLARLRRQSRSS